MRPHGARRAARRGRADGAGGGPAGIGRPAPDTPPPDGAGPSTAPAPPGGAPGGPNLLPMGPVRPECRGLARAAVRLDAPAVERTLERAVAELGVVTSWEEVMVPALRAVGRKWAAEGEKYVEVEHLLSWHVSTALRSVARSPGAAAGPALPVLLAGMPGEQHSLPLDAAAAGLSSRELPYRMFGPAVPADALLAAVGRTGPSAVLLWAQSRATADRRLVLQAATTGWGVRGARSRPAVVLAGPGWAGLPRTAGTLRPRSLGQALDLLAGLASPETWGGPGRQPAAAAPAASARARSVMLRAMPPNTTPWNGATAHQ
ncbi:hypothetical protein GCM10025734_71980 [Kitasatospora paranensis]